MDDQPNQDLGSETEAAEFQRNNLSLFTLDIGVLENFGSERTNLDQWAFSIGETVHDSGGSDLLIVNNGDGSDFGESKDVPTFGESASEDYVADAEMEAHATQNNLKQLGVALSSAPSAELDVGGGPHVKVFNGVTAQSSVPTEEITLNYGHVEGSYEEGQQDDGGFVTPDLALTDVEAEDYSGNALIFGESASEDYVAEEPSEPVADGGDIILVEIVGAEWAGIEAPDSFVFQLDPPSDLNEPTRPDPGDADGEALLFSLSASEDYAADAPAEPAAYGQDLGGGGDFLLLDIRGHSAAEFDLV